MTSKKAMALSPPSLGGAAALGAAAGGWPLNLVTFRAGFKGRPAPSIWISCSASRISERPWSHIAYLRAFALRYSLGPTPTALLNLRLK
jgi:hypothetical protein